MLNGTLTLHDIRDVEAFCAHFLHKRNRAHDEDLLAYLIEETWILSQRYDGTRGSRFSAWARLTLERHLIQYDRNEADTRYEAGRLKRAAQHLPLDDQLGDHLPPRPMDDPAHRDPDLLRHLRNRDSQDTRPYPTLDQRPTRAAA